MLPNGVLFIYTKLKIRKKIEGNVSQKEEKMNNM